MSEPTDQTCYFCGATIKEEFPRVIQLPNGNELRIWEDGTTVTDFPDGRWAGIQSDGMTSIHFPDGRWAWIFEDGKTSTDFPDGREACIYVDGMTTVDFPDGRRVWIRVDGTTETGESAPLSDSRGAETETVGEQTRMMETDQCPQCSEMVEETDLQCNYCGLSQWSAMELADGQTFTQWTDENWNERIRFPDESEGYIDDGGTMFYELPSWIDSLD